MNNVLLYAITVLIWGTTWFAIKLQVGHAPDEVSIFYRSALAGIALLAWCRIRKINLRFPLKDHVFFCLLGMCMSSLHFLFVYNATNYLVSGIISVAFAGVSFLSIFNNFLFFRIKPKWNVVLGSLIGVGGLCVFFWHEVVGVHFEEKAFQGLVLCSVGTVIFSLGGSVSKRNNNRGLPLLPAMTWGVVYGALTLLVYIWLRGSSFVLPESSEYWGSLMYLVIFGSLIGFTSYLQIVKNLGPELAGYTTVLYPVIALITSAVMEGYRWSWADCVGLLLVMIGNALVMHKKKNPSVSVQ